MDTWIYLSQGFAVAMTPENLVIALIGCFVGTIVGLLPGLGPINGVAILLPLAFALHLPAESALILLATVYIGCEYGGRVRGTQHHVRSGADGGARHTGLHSAQNALPHVAADPRLCAGRNAGAEPAPRALYQQRQYGDFVGERCDESAADDGDSGDYHPAAAAPAPQTQQ